MYLAEDAKLDRKVALEVLPPELAENDERRARFEREPSRCIQSALDIHNELEELKAEPSSRELQELRPSGGGTSIERALAFATVALLLALLGDLAAERVR